MIHSHSQHKGDSTMLPSPNDYLEAHYDRFLEELKAWLRIPSISTLQEHTKDVYTAAKWAEKKLEAIGFPLFECIPTKRHPLVYGEWLPHDDQPTILIYGHYDVQPVDPLDEWLSDPFDPVIRDGNLYCRGACDDKAQIMLVLAALEAWSRSEHGLPVNVKVLLEGEEESGGESIDAFVPEETTKLQADLALICDTHILGPSQPSLINGLRGILYTEIAVSGAKSDLHSGTYGGVAPNPIHALCVLISRLKGEDGKINIPELEENLPEVSPEEKKFWQEDPLNLSDALLEEMGVEELVGEENYPPLERVGVRPTLEIHGIRGGFTADGAKTVIPAEALAKVSMRLPAGISSETAFSWLQKAVEQQTPSGHRVSITMLAGGGGIGVALDNQYIQAASLSLENVYGVPPVFMREGGSVPIAALFDKLLKIPVVLMGFGLPDDGLHAPNEKFSLDQFDKGMKTVADFLGRIRR